MAFVIFPQNIISKMGCSLYKGVAYLWVFHASYKYFSKKFKDYSRTFQGHPTLFKDSSLLHLNRFVFFCQTRLSKNQRNQSDLFKQIFILCEAHTFEVLHTRSHKSSCHCCTFFKKISGKIKTNSNVFPAVTAHTKHSALHATLYPRWPWTLGLVLS